MAVVIVDVDQSEYGLKRGRSVSAAISHKVMTTCAHNVGHALAPVSLLVQIHQHCPGGSRGRSVVLGVLLM